MAQWAPKIGDAAAELRWRGLRFVLRSNQLNLVWVSCVIAGAKLGIAALVAIGIVLAVVSAALIEAAGAKFRQANREASAVLGIRLGFRRIAPPPREPEHYLSWCARYGVAPYTANGE